MWHRHLGSRSLPAVYSSAEECQNILQEGRPTFVPTFSNLHEICLRRASQKLQELDQCLRQTPDGSPERTEFVEEATRLLQDLDRQVASILDRHELEDPEYAEAHGLSVTHFNMDDGPNRGDWMLLASNWGPQSKSITESGVDKLSAMQKKWLRQFSHLDQLPPIVAFKRRKTTVERQWHAIRTFEDSPILVRNEKMLIFWKCAFGLAFICLILFLGVGIIATTTTFSPVFVKTFFWIAIVWTIVSSGLLVFVVRLFGGDGKDCPGAMLAAVAIWLVVIQIGQTHLSIQVPE